MEDNLTYEEKLEDYLEEYGEELSDEDLDDLDFKGKEL